jgi:hypothetical protein
MSTLEILLRVAGVVQFTILIASALVPRVLDWRANLALLHPFLRRLFWVYGIFIVLVIASFGTLTLVNARAMAAGDPAARSLCAFIAIFWLARLAAQFFVFDFRLLTNGLLKAGCHAPSHGSTTRGYSFLTNGLLKAGYHGLTLAFIYLTVINAWAALLPAHGNSSL